MLRYGHRLAEAFLEREVTTPGLNISISNYAYVDRKESILGYIPTPEKFLTPAGSACPLRRFFCVSTHRPDHPMPLYPRRSSQIFYSF